MPSFLIRGQLQFDGQEAALRELLVGLGFTSVTAQDEAEEQRDRYLDAAQELSREGVIEVDDDAIVSSSDDDGAYVAAWLWVPHPWPESHDESLCTCSLDVVDATCDACGDRHCPCPCSDCREACTAEEEEEQCQPSL